MTAASAEMVERFLFWKASAGMGGGGAWSELSAREADGFQVLEEEWRAEIAHGEHNRN